MNKDIIYYRYSKCLTSQVNMSLLKDIGLQFNFFLYIYKIYSLCKNNAISKVLNKLQVFHFRCTVHTNTTPTVITHSCVLQKPPSATIMVIIFCFKICRPNRHVSKILAKKVKFCNLEGDCEQNGSTGNVATWGVLIYS